VSLRFDIDLDIDILDARVAAATPEGLAAGMEHIRQVSAPLVPVETGRLVGSAEVQVDGDRASLSYAGPYARYQHERLDLRHEHGQAKYLEQPVLTDGDKAVEIVGEVIKREAL
jgi:hypothetical protein